MESVKLMIEEHKYIKRMLVLLRKVSINILNGEDVPYEDFKKMIKFVRDFADNHHHGKEEKMFFNKMVEELGPAAEKLVTNGMLVEHDLGRLHIKQLEEALERNLSGDTEAKVDIIANSISYTDLLYRHIDKEDNVVFSYGERNFNDQTKELINTEFEKFEDTEEAKNAREVYIGMLVELEEKYL